LRARRLQANLGGTLQDGGVPLTVHRIERMRQKCVSSSVRRLARPGAGSWAHL
jgi:hypothetical protein